MKLVVSTIAALALFAAVGQAAPLDTKNVAANAKWVVHVDVDAIRDSHVVQKAFKTCPVLKDHAGQHFDMIRDKIGIDLRKDLHGMTLYGPDTDKTHAVAIVFSTVNQHLLLEKAEHATDHKVTKHGDIDIHSWTQKQGGKSRPAAGAFYKSDVLVFAASVEGVAAAIDVLEGKSPGISDAKSALGGRPPAGATLVVRSTAIPAETKCAILKQVESFRVAMGESAGESFYRASAVMKSAEAAVQVKAINDGLKALGALRFAGDADVMKLVDGLKTTVNDKIVRVRWDASAEDVWKVVEKIGKKAAEHFQQHGGTGKPNGSDSADHGDGT
jgi:hypothetical protein